MRESEGIQYGSLVDVRDQTHLATQNTKRGARAYNCGNARARAHSALEANSDSSHLANKQMQKVEKYSLFIFEIAYLPP